jgi:hypothetical protein
MELACLDDVGRGCRGTGRADDHPLHRAAAWNRHHSVGSFARQFQGDAGRCVPALFPDFSDRARAASYLCAVHDAVETFYVAQLEAMPEDPSAVPAAERDGRLAALRRDKWDLETWEEAVVLALLAAGQPIGRRGDAPPPCSAWFSRGNPDPHGVFPLTGPPRPQ